MSFRKFVSIASLIVLTVPTISRADSTAELNQILGVFNSSCPSNGQWTQAALGYTNKIVGVLREIQTDPDCQSLSGSLTDMQLMSTVFGNVVQDQTQSAISGLESEQKELLILISQSTGDTSSLLSQLQSVNVQLATDQGNATYTDAYQNLRRQGQALSFLVDGTKNILRQATQNEACLKKNKSLLPAIVGLAGAVGATLVTGGGALYVAAGVEVLNLVVDGARTHHIARQIRQLNSITAATAFSCVLEGMSNQWCAAEDAQSIVKLKAGSIVGSGTPAPIEGGIKVMSRDYPRFLSWLNTVSSGSDPANGAMGDRQAAFDSLNYSFQAGRAKALSLIAEEAVVLATISNPDDQWKEVKTFVMKIESTLQSYGSSDTNPFFSVIGSQYSTVVPWLLVGVPENLIPFGQGSSSTSLESLSSPTYTYQYVGQRLGLTNYVPSLDIVKQSFLTFASRAQVRLDGERARVMYADPCKLIANAATTNIAGTSPYQSLQSIITYLQLQTAPSGAYGSFRGIYTETQNTLGEISRVIESSLNSTCTTPSGQQAVNQIFSLARLENGSGFLSERLNWAVQLSLNDLVVHGQGTTPGQAAALLAADNVITEMNSYSPNLSFDDMIKDMKHSQLLLDGTIQAFSDNFADDIARNIYDFKRQAEAQGEDALGTNNEAWDKSCVLLLSIPKWPRAVPKELCIGRSIKSEFAGWPSSPMITEAMMEPSSNTRAKSVCAFRDYQRANWLFQRYHERN
jgi:hypothetical protein